MQPPSVDTPGARTSSNYVKQQLIDRVRRRRGVRRRATRARPRSTSRSRRRRGARSRSGSPTRTGRRPRSSRSTRATAASIAMVGARTSARASSTSPSRASGSRARRSSRSCSRPALAAGHLARIDVRVEADHDLARRPDSGRSRTTRARTSGAINLYDATTHSDNAVYAQLTELVGPSEVRDDRHRLGVTSRAQRLLRDRARRRGGQPARDGARVLDVREQRHARRRGDVREPSARRRSRCATSKQGRGERPVEQAVLELERRRRIRHVHAPERRPGGDRASAPRSRDRPVAGKTGTTENYGDAWFVGYTPQLAVAVWVGYPNEADPDADRVPRRPGRGRHVSGADLEERSPSRALAVPGRAARVVPCPPIPLGHAGARHCRTAAGCVDNGNCRGSRRSLYVDGYGPTSGRLQAERGRRAERRRPERRGRAEPAGGTAARAPRSSTGPRSRASSSAIVVDAVPEGRRTALVLATRCRDRRRGRCTG